MCCSYYLIISFKGDTKTATSDYSRDFNGYYNPCDSEIYSSIFTHVKLWIAVARHNLLTQQRDFDFYYVYVTKKYRCHRFDKYFAF